MTRTVHRTCHLCEAMCGLILEVDDRHVLSVVGDEDDPLSEGYLCPKGAAIGDVHADPDRLRRPMVRVDGELVPTDWETALDTAAQGLQGVIDEHGRDAVGLYLGNPTVHSHGSLFLPLLIKAIASKNLFTASTVDQRPQEFVQLHLYGHPLLVPVPDVDRSDHLLLFGANPAVSNGSLWTAPNLRRRLKDVGERGGQVVLFDPRRTESARVATSHHFVRPGTDALLLAALCATIAEEGLVDLGSLDGLVDGLDEVVAALAPYSPEAVASRTGVAADVIRTVARDFAAAPRAAAYGRVGICHQTHGTTAAWLIHVLNIMTGNLDRPGGVMFTTPALDIPSLTGGSAGRWRSRVHGYPEFSGELPVATLADEALTPGEGQIRGFLTHAGNPVLSTPDGERVDAALRGMEFVVSIDIYLNETTRHADVILPPNSALERSHYDHIFSVLAVRNVAKFSEPVFEPPQDGMEDWAITVELARRLYGDPDRAATIARRFGEVPDVDALVDLGLRTGPHADRGLSLEKLEDAPSGLDLGPLKSVLPGRLKTPDKRIDVAPAVLLETLGGLEEGIPAETEDGYDLTLIGRRQLRSNNSWMHNIPRLVKGRDRCTLLLHPDDAAARGIEDGACVRIESRVGSVEAPAEVSDEIMAGVVSLPHGWGHGRDDTRWEIANDNAGVSVNTVTDATVVDRLTGNAAFSDVRVRVQNAG